MTHDSLSYLTLSTYLQDELDRLVDLTKKAIQTSGQNYRRLAETFYSLQNLAKDLLPPEHTTSNFSQLIARLLLAVKSNGASTYYSLLESIQQLIDIGCSAIEKTNDTSLKVQFEYSYDILDDRFFREAFFQLKAHKVGQSYAA
jgi:hypothetical protein